MKFDVKTMMRDVVMTVVLVLFVLEWIVFGVVALLQLNEVPGTHDLALNVFGVAVLSWPLIPFVLNWYIDGRVKKVMRE